MLKRTESYYPAGCLQNRPRHRPFGFSEKHRHEFQACFFWSTNKIELKLKEQNYQKTKDHSSDLEDEVGQKQTNLTCPHIKQNEFGINNSAIFQNHYLFIVYIRIVIFYIIAVLSCKDNMKTLHSGVLHGLFRNTHRQTCHMINCKYESIDYNHFKADVQGWKNVFRHP